MVSMIDLVFIIISYLIIYTLFGFGVDSLFGQNSSACHNRYL